MVTIDDSWVEFVFFRPGARRVCVAGDFNGWRTSDINMVCVSDGHWRVRVRLPAGEYRFRYCADGEWFADYAACGLEPGRFGMDSLLCVPPKSLSLRTDSVPKNREGATIFAA